MPLTARQQSAQQELVLLMEDIAGAPGVEHRGVEFWVEVVRRLCEKHGCQSLAINKEDKVQVGIR